MTGYSAELSSIKKNWKEEVDHLKAELCQCPAQMMVYPTSIKHRIRLTFSGNKRDNPDLTTFCIMVCYHSVVSKKY